jgi:ATP-binding cassette subfamily B protein
MSIFKYFWISIKPYKWWYGLMLLAPVVTAFYTPLTNFAVKTIIDIMVENAEASYSNLLNPIVIFISAQILMDVSWRLSNFAEWKSEPYVRKDLLIRTYDYTQHHSYNFFQNNFTGSLTNKITKIVDGYNKFWSELHHGFLINFLNTIVGIASLFLINIDIGYFISIWSITLFTIIYLLSGKLIKISDTLSQAKHRLVGAISDKIANISSIMLFTGRKTAIQSLTKQINIDLIPKEIKEYKYNFLIQIVGGIFYLVMLISLLFILINFKKQNIISVGDFAYIFATILAVGHDLWHLVTKLQEFFSYMGEAQASLDIINKPHEIRDKSNAKVLEVKTPSIEYKNIYFYYNHNLIFENLNIKIAAGEKVGLVGHSGAGKSSLINLLLKYFYPSAGTILVGNTSIETVTQDSLRQNIAMIPQDIMLFHDSIMENIRYSKPKATDDEVMEAAKKAHIHDYILTLPHGYNTPVGERGLKISGGQRQRIAIARAMLKDAPILILDEATSSLDSKTEKLIQESIELLLKDTKKTIIAIAHRLSTIKDMDRIIVLDQGKIVEEGTHFQLMKIKNGIYQDLWKHQRI